MPSGFKYQTITMATYRIIVEVRDEVETSLVGVGVDFHPGTPWDIINNFYYELLNTQCGDRNFKCILLQKQDEDDEEDWDTVNEYWQSEEDCRGV